MCQLVFLCPGARVRGTRLDCRYCVELADGGTHPRSLIRRKDVFKIIGVPIRLAQHPRLGSLVRDIASLLNEPIPESIYLVPDANAFIAERRGAVGLGSHVHGAWFTADGEHVCVGVPRALLA